MNIGHEEEHGFAAGNRLVRDPQGAQIITRLRLAARGDAAAHALAVAVAVIHDLGDGGVGSVNGIQVGVELVHRAILIQQRVDVSRVEHLGGFFVHSQPPALLRQLAIGGLVHAGQHVLFGQVVVFPNVITSEILQIFDLIVINADGKIAIRQAAVWRICLDGGAPTWQGYGQYQQRLRQE